MTILEGGTKLKRFLKLNPSEANKCFDRTISMIRRRFIVDVFALDDILHERHGEYEKDGLSMEDCIRKHYGEEAATFVKLVL